MERIGSIASGVYLSIGEAGQRCHGLARDDTMPVTPGNVANWPYLVIITTVRAIVWDVQPHIAKGEGRWQRCELPRWTSGLGIQNAILLFVVVHEQEAHSR